MHELQKKIEAVLQELRPAIKRDGGDIVFVRFDAGVVYVQLQGACAHCPASFFTLKMGVEEALRSACPEVTSVVPI